MRVIKRNNESEVFSFDKISKRLDKLAKKTPRLDHIDNIQICKKIVDSIYDNITTTELDIESARISVNIPDHSDYQELAARIYISNLHKNTLGSFSETVKIIHENKSIKYNKKFLEIATGSIGREILDKKIDYSRDYKFDYLGLKALEKGYLYGINGKIYERPQDLYMRVALQVHLNEFDTDNQESAIENVLHTYELISEHYFTFASPTMFNSGLELNNLSSCFLLGTEDSIEGIYKTITDCAKISKIGGGIGIHINNIRTKGSKIHSNGGISDGIIPMIRVYNSTCTYVNQSGKRKGSFCMYLSPDNPEIMSFLDLRKNQGADELRARDIFIALWIPDLFMKAVLEDLDWHTFNPGDCPDLQDVYGSEYETLIAKYISENKIVKTFKARDIWHKILETQIETGTPFILYKDRINSLSNQKNIGTIKSSNLCAEIALYSDSKEYAVCNLMSVSLPKFINKQYISALEEANFDPTQVSDKNIPKFNFKKMIEVVKYAVLPMNNIIDCNFYPIPETRKSNMKHRPIGIGVQGLSDVFTKLKIPFDSPEAKELNSKIFESIYYGAISGSSDLAAIHGPYSSYEGSPFSQGLFQYDLHGKTEQVENNSDLNWKALKAKVKKHGMRNSTLTTCMPTANSSIMMRNTEAFECFDSCIYKRRLLSGEFVITNKNLMDDLNHLGIYSKELREKILINNGSIQGIIQIPENIRKIYKTVWETSQKTIMNYCSDRQLYIDMTQSMNLFMERPTINKLSSALMYGYQKGLKTGMYYLRSKPYTQNSKFTIDPELEKQVLSCSLENKENCELCSA